MICKRCGAQAFVNAYQDGYICNACRHGTLECGCGPQDMENPDQPVILFRMWPKEGG